MAISDPFIDDLVMNVVACPGSRSLMRHLAEILIADGCVDAARTVAVAALREHPGDIRLLGVLVDAGVEAPDTVAAMAALWNAVPAPAEC